MANEVQPHRFTLEEVQDTNGPFYIHLNKSPSLVLISTLLSSSNFHNWQCSFKMSLLMKNKIGFIDGSIQEPEKQDATYLY